MSAKNDEAVMIRYAALYFSTILVMVPLDILFLGVIAKGFFQSQVGPVMGDLNLTAALLFYLLYAAGIVVFVSGATDVTWQDCVIYGAFFGLVAYGTFDLTALALIQGWKWAAAAVDMSWGAFVTAVSATLGLQMARLFAKLLGA